MSEITPKIVAVAVAGLGGAVLFYFSDTHPGYLTSQTYMGDLLFWLVRNLPCPQNLQAIAPGR